MILAQHKLASNQLAIFFLKGLALDVDSANNIYQIKYQIIMSE